MLRLFRRQVAVCVLASASGLLGLTSAGLTAACSNGPAGGSGGAATGGQTDPGGAGPTGGSAAGGAGGAGAPGTGGAPPEVLEPEMPDLEGKTEVDCSIEITSAELSDTISTVGIIEFSSDLLDVARAVIEFGLTTDYGLVAPVALQGNNRTLLLGMTTDSEYHYRVLAVSDEEYCYGPDQTIGTGPLAAGGPSHLTPEAGGSSAPKAPGFFVTTQFNGEWAYVFDQDGRIVWFYQLPFVQSSRAHLSWDGKRMYVKHLNVGRNEVGRFFEVGLDGSAPREINLPTSHHDFSVMPGGIVYIRKTPDSDCDSLYFHADGAADATTDVPIFDVEEAFPSGGGTPILGDQSCHTNSVDYSARDLSYTASDLTFNAYFKVSATGELAWVLGSDDSTIGGDVSWDKQHGHHFLPGNVLLFFNNASQNGSVAREIGLDLEASSPTATFLPFVYDSGQVSGTMGDVQRLPNGNTVVFYSNQGVVHEVGPDAELVQSFELSTGSGYGSHRPALYGKPPE